MSRSSSAAPLMSLSVAVEAAAAAMVAAAVAMVAAAQAAAVAMAAAVQAAAAAMVAAVLLAPVAALYPAGRAAGAPEGITGGNGPLVLSRTSLEASSEGTGIVAGM